MLEWDIDVSAMLARESMHDTFHKAVSAGKRVVITTDSYYSSEQIKEILTRFDLTGYDEIFVSCEYEISKTQGLFRALRNRYKTQKILHIGDDEVSDIEKAEAEGMDTLWADCSEKYLPRRNLYIFLRHEPRQYVPAWKMRKILNTLTK